MSQHWELLNPESVVKIESMELTQRPNTLESKIILLRWNGKNNGNHFLARIGELLIEAVKDVKIIKSWEIAPETAVISGNPKQSNQFVEKLAKLKPDLVIASQGD